MESSSGQELLSNTSYLFSFINLIYIFVYFYIVHLKYLYIFIIWFIQAAPNNWEEILKKRKEIYFQEYLYILSTEINNNKKRLFNKTSPATKKAYSTVSKAMKEEVGGMTQPSLLRTSKSITDDVNFVCFNVDTFVASMQIKLSFFLFMFSSWSKFFSMKHLNLSSKCFDQITQFPYILLDVMSSRTACLIVVSANLTMTLIDLQE